MCFEMCGPESNDPEELKAYQEWLDSFTVEDVVEPGDIIPEVDDDDSEEESNTVSESEARERFDEFLDEIHSTVKCGELEWDMSRVLKEMDPTAYQCGLNDWLDSEGLEIE